MPRETFSLIVSAAILLTGLGCPQRAKQENRDQEMKVFEFHTIVGVYRHMLAFYREENGVYPGGDSIQDLVAVFEPRYAEMLRKKLDEWFMGRPPAFETKYLDRLPTKDPWGNEIRFISWPEGSPVHYRIGSAGRDGLWEHADLRDYKPRVTFRFQGYCFDSDIIWSDEGRVTGADLE